MFIRLRFFVQFQAYVKSLMRNITWNYLVCLPCQFVLWMSFNDDEIQKKVFIVRCTHTHCWRLPVPLTCAYSCITNDIVWYWNSLSHTKEEPSVSDILLSRPQGYANLLFRCSTLIMLLHTFYAFTCMMFTILKIVCTTLKSQETSDNVENVKEFFLLEGARSIKFLSMWLWNQTLPWNTVSDGLG